MAGTFVPMDAPRCDHYAQFASHLWRWQFDLIYWILFVFNLFILFLASWGYIKALDVMDKLPEGSPRRRKLLIRYIVFCLVCVAVSIVTVVMEVFVLLALQFCDGEDLMSLYWSTWTMIQVGSLMAVFGIILALLHSLRDKKHPPWALALGTPVLVFAGLFHFLHNCVTQRFRKLNRKRKESEDGTLPISQVNTLAVDSEDELNGIHGAVIIGLTLEGGPIIHFKQAIPYSFPDTSQILGYCGNDKPIVACRKDSVQFIYNNPPSTQTND